MVRAAHTVRVRFRGDVAGALQSAPVNAPLPDLILYGRPGCHLCEDAHEALLALLARRAETGLPVPGVVDCNIEDDEAWHARYAFTIPVLTYGDRELDLATSSAKIGRFLAEALDGAPEP